MRSVLVTGGTGSFGSRLVEFLYKNNSDLEFVIFSRDEQKHYQMRLKYNNSPRLHFVVGDVRDLETITGAMEEYKPHYVIHTAAMKHVLICDQNPMQAVLTNIHGTKNVAKACVTTGVQCACFVSTDKSVQPTTLYGMTKHIAERIWLNYSKNQKEFPKFFGVRYGNVVNSAGSLIPFYLDIAKSSKVFPLTNVNMTRFFITFDQAINWIVFSFLRHCSIQLVPKTMCNLKLNSVDQDIFYIPQLPSAKIVDIANIFADICTGQVKITGEYPSEKMHEILTLNYSSKDNLLEKSDIYALLEQENLLPEKK